MSNKSKDNYFEIAARLQAIIDTAIDGIIIIDDRGLIESINEAAATLFNHSKESVIGKNITMLMPDPYKSEHDGYLRRYSETKVPHIIGTGREVQGLKKNGDIFPFRLAVGEVVLNDRLIYTGIIHDLSEIHKAQQNLKDANEVLEFKVDERTREMEKVVNRLLETNSLLEKRETELKLSIKKERELNDLKSRFVSMASHEFRTPLSTILSSAAIISRYTETDQQSNREKHVGRIKSAVTTLTGILNDFLSLGKLEEGAVEVNEEEVGIYEIIVEVRDELQGLLKNDQKIVTQGSLKTTTVYTDKRILKNILFNLLSNAIKYSNSGDQIILELQKENNDIKLSVIDQGIGIPDADQKYLFSNFFRASNVENIQGTGLGLQIVKRYVHLLGGTIDFSSEVGQGATFTFTIPTGRNIKQPIQY